MNTQTITVRSFTSALAIALFALALTLIAGVSDAHAASNASSTASSTKGMNNKKVDATCMVAAIDDREDALMNAWEEMSSSTMAALEDRRNGLMSAWGKTTMKERTAALVKIWKEWRTDKKAITAEFRNDRKAAWDTFKKTAKNECKIVTPKDENLEKAVSDAIAL